MPLRAQALFDAYQNDELPKDGGYIVTSFFAEHSSYSIYEIVSYNAVKSIFVNDEGMTFQSDGKKIFILVEPPSFPRKHIEPYNRSDHEKIPHRFNELEIFTCKNQMKIMVSKEPIVTYGSFTIMRPTNINFSFVFYGLPDVFDSMNLFFQKTLNKEAGIPQIEAKQASRTIQDILPKLNFTF
ncbi:hypothetical protein [Spirochaeta cellobiosiphila]|uniref:hypothetical protein n=1 Tax=Spirochaeta cellobiosiphila TaxID=504483 RepID=UPI00040276E4|nr:hypothetical protein [Spirochaeta cellobiosiphila]